MTENVTSQCKRKKISENPKFYENTLVLKKNSRKNMVLQLFKSFAHYTPQSKKRLTIPEKKKKHQHTQNLKRTIVSFCNVKRIDDNPVGDNKKKTDKSQQSTIPDSSSSAFRRWKSMESQPVNLCARILHKRWEE